LVFITEMKGVYSMVQKGPLNKAVCALSFKRLNWEAKGVSHSISVLGFQKGCARWVPQELTDEIKAGRVRVSRELLGHIEGEDEGFL
jgi:hypothetical protein